MNTQKQQEALNFLKNAFIYKQDIKKTVFNDDPGQETNIKNFKNACFNSDMEIRDFDFKVYNEAVDYIQNNYIQDTKISDDLTLDDIINDIDNLDFEDTEPDIYTSDLLAWLQEDLHNIGYCDEAISELAPETFTDILSGGQYLARQEKMQQAKNAVIEYLQNYTN